MNTKMTKESKKQEPEKDSFKDFSNGILNDNGKYGLPEYKVSISPSLSDKFQNTRRLESIAGGPLKLNEDGTFNLETINHYLNKHHLGLEIVYFENENKYGFSLYRTANPLIDEVKKFSDEGAFHSVKDHTFPFPKHESKHVEENPNEIIISGARYNYTPKKKDKK